MIFKPAGSLFKPKFKPAGSLNLKNFNKIIQTMQTYADMDWIQFPTLYVYLIKDMEQPTFILIQTSTPQVCSLLKYIRLVTHFLEEFKKYSKGGLFWNILNIG